MPKIYTKAGDKGLTSLCGGERVLKSDPVIEANGDLDECNCIIGLVRCHLAEQGKGDSLQKQLYVLQHLLFDGGSVISAQKSQEGFSAEAAAQLEEWIDEMEKTLPPLRHFILPGGHPLGAHLQLARAVCRRAERRLVALAAEHDVNANVLAFVNRLSDYFFVASRYINHLLEAKETLWVKDPLHAVQL